MRESGVASRELIESGMRAIRERLEALGFTAHLRQNSYTLPLAPHLLGGVLLGRAIHRGDGSMEVTISIMLLHEQVERLLSALGGKPYHRYQGPGTVQDDLGFLVSGHRTFRVVFTPGASVDAVAEEITQPIAVVALPWMHAHASLEEIAALLRDPQVFKGGYYDNKVALVEWMVGRPEAARAYIRDYVRALAARGGPNSGPLIETYQRFATHLEALMALRHWLPTADAERLYLRTLRGLQPSLPSPSSSESVASAAAERMTRQWSSPAETPNATMLLSRETLAHDLLSYGENDAARHVMELSNEDLRWIGTRSLQLALMPGNGNAAGRGRSLSKAVAQAAIERLEGQARPLHYARRRQ